MKRSELKNIVREIVENTYIDLSKVKTGDTKVDPEIGAKSTLSSIDPETGKLTWDIEYDVDPKFLYNKLDQLVNYLQKVPKGSELAQYKDILKNLKNKTSRLMKQQ